MSLSKKLILTLLLESENTMDLMKTSFKIGMMTLLHGGIHLVKKCLVNLEIEGILELFIDYSYSNY